MRNAFFDQLYEIAKGDHSVILLSGDFGAPSLDKFRGDLSSQFFSMGVAEQNMVNVARGLAMAGKVVYTYAILPFYMRCYEQIRHICMQNLNINMVGVGTGFAYSTDGPTHHALEDVAAMRALPNLTILNASDNVMAEALARLSFENLGPKYIRLDRYSLTFYDMSTHFNHGYVYVRMGSDLTIIASGYMVHQALKVASELSKQGVDAGVIDFFRIKPLNQEMISKAMQKPRRIVTLEENFISGGIGSIVSEILIDEQHSRLKRIGIPNKYYFKYSGREELHRLAKLDVESIAKEISEWLEVN